MKRYILIEGQDFLKISVSYEKGGYNYFTGKQSQRGYYLYVKKVKVDRHEDGVTMESFVLYTSGYKEILLETKRKAQKYYDLAVEKMDSRWTKLAELVLKDHGYAVSLKTLLDNQTSDAFAEKVIKDALNNEKTKENEEK